MGRHTIDYTEWCFHLYLIMSYFWRRILILQDHASWLDGSLEHTLGNTGFVSSGFLFGSESCGFSWPSHSPQTKRTLYAVLVLLIKHLMYVEITECSQTSSGLLHPNFSSGLDPKPTHHSLLRDHSSFPSVLQSPSTLQPIKQVYMCPFMHQKITH